MEILSLTFFKYIFSYFLEASSVLTIVEFDELFLESDLSDYFDDS